MGREGVWRDDLDMFVTMGASPPHLVTSASPGWLAFCGFCSKEVVGSTLHTIQGPLTEPDAVSNLLTRVHSLLHKPANPQPSPIRCQLTNYTKHGLCFINHLAITPHAKGNAVELVTRTESVEVISSLAPMRFRPHAKHADGIIADPPANGDDRPTGPLRLRRCRSSPQTPAAEDDDCAAFRMMHAIRETVGTDAVANSHAQDAGAAGGKGRAGGACLASLDGSIMSSIDEVDEPFMPTGDVANPQRA